MLTIALWPGTSGFASRALLGRPVWRRTLAAAEGLGAGRIVWLGPPPNEAPEELVVGDPTMLWTRRDTVVVIPAELPCLTTATLRALLKRGRRRAHLLSAPGDGRASVAVAAASEWKRALAGFSAPRLEEAVLRLAPAVQLPREPEELLLVETPETWTRAVRVLRSRKMAELLRRGVLVSDPESTLVDPEVSIGAGTKLLPWVHLEGRTKVGQDVVISSFTHVVDSDIGAGTVLLDHCFIRGSRIGKRAQIGPFAHLRPDSDVAEEAKVGNFVELKNTKLGRGAKAPHLSYLGDAVIGKAANVGAGTITCNYDGVTKHRTVVGDEAFIGSDVQLVAPVHVGKGAYVAAGSCIVEDVPAYALALARSRQVVKRGWAKHRATKGRKRS